MEEKGFWHECGLDTALDLAIGNYEQERKAYWENRKGDSAIAYDRAERFAEAVLKSSESLVQAETLDEDLKSLHYEAQKVQRLPEGRRLLNEFLRNLPKMTPKEIGEYHKKFVENLVEDPRDQESPLRLVWERFAISLAWESETKVLDGADRLFMLYGLVLQCRPCKATQQFLSRLSRCYIWGFDPECVMLCRSVLDTAFHDAVSDDLCEQCFGKRTGEFTLGDRFLAAQKRGMIDKVTYDLAIVVKERGNKAVHYQIDVTKDVFGTIQDTVTVLEKLNNAR